MVQYDYSREENNPWDAATWNPRTQLDFMRRVRAAWPKANAEDRIRQRIAQSDTHGIPPKKQSTQAPFQVIIQRRYLVPESKDTTLGFGLAGPVVPRTQWTLPVLTERVQFPSSTVSDARCDVAPTNDVTLTLSTANNTVLCVVTFPAGSQIGTFAWSVPAGLICQPGDLLYLFANGPNDPTFAGANLAFIGRQLG
jgi:hypothetical protein